MVVAGYHVPRRSRCRRGMTLLEVLLIVFILSTIAMSAVALTDRLDLQFRFDDTQTRLELIRRAVVGDPSREANGTPVVSGFVADVGRLPNNLQELIESGATPLWQLDATSGLWFGWRGPYLETFRETISGLKAYRDGWGNIDPIPANDAVNFGWNFVFEPSPGELVVQSYGSDGTPGGPPGDDYAADFPPLLDSLVTLYDHQVDVQSWVVKVEFYNPPGGAGKLPSSDEDLRVRLYYPQDGALNWIDSGTEQLKKNAVKNNKTKDIDFTFLAGQQLLPWGARSLVVIDDTDSVYIPGANSPEAVTFVSRAQLATVVFRWNLE